MFNQGKELIAKIHCTIKPSKGRGITVKPEQKFVVTSPQYKNVEGAMVDRASKGMINSGYWLSLAQLKEIFDV